jgi:hypothetical protein
MNEKRNVASGRHAIVLVPLLMILAGCPKKKGADASDAASEAGPVAVVDAGPETTNEAQVTRYADDEKPVDRADATVKIAKTNALTAVPRGDVITSLKKGDAVTQLALHGGYYLVIFADPKDPTKKLSGWVPKQAFDDATYVPVKRQMPACAAGTLLVTNSLSPLMPRCAKPCTKSSECDSKMCDSVIQLDPKTGAPAGAGSNQYVQACEAVVPVSAPPSATGAVVLPKADAGAKH